MITPVMAFWSNPASANKFRVSTPYSSTVRSRAVVKRQFATSSSPRNTPSTVLVLPTSMVSSIYRASVTSPEITAVTRPSSRSTCSNPSGPRPAVVPT